MRIFNWFKRTRKTNGFFDKEGHIKITRNLSENDKALAAGIIYGMPTNLKFNLHLITEEVLIQYRDDFGFQEGTKEHHDAYVNWMKYLGLDYYKHRYVIRNLIRGIYHYTKGKLDFRNERMRKEISYKQKSNKKSKHKS